MIVGTFMAFDRHMNMVLGDSEEFRRIKSKKGQVEFLLKIFLYHIFKPVIQTFINNRV